MVKIYSAYKNEFSKFAKHFDHDTAEGVVNAAYKHKKGINTVFKIAQKSIDNKLAIQDKRIEQLVDCCFKKISEHTGNHKKKKQKFTKEDVKKLKDVFTAQKAQVKAKPNASNPPIAPIAPNPPNPPIVINDGNTQLHIACENNKKETIDALIKSGINVHAKNNKGETALIIACEKKNKDIALQLIPHAAASINTPNKDGVTPLELACSSNMPEVVEALLQAGATIDIRNSIGNTLLNTYCESNNTAIVLKLIPYAKSILNIPDKFSMVPLHMACSHNALEVVDALLKAGANVNVQDRSGNWIVRIIWTNFNSAILLKLIPYIKPTLNTLDHYGDTLLHMACSYNMPEVVDALLQAGANTNIHDSTGKTAFGKACCNNHNAAIALKFIPYIKSTLNTPDQVGKTPLHRACDGNMPEVVEALLQAGASPDTQEPNDKDTPLNLACFRNRTDISLKLIPYVKSTLDTPDKNGRTPLYYACQKGMTEVVEALLQAGANVDVQDCYENTPLMLLSAKDNPHLFLKVFEKARQGNMLARNDTNQTFLNCLSVQCAQALFAGYPTIVNLLTPDSIKDVLNNITNQLDDPSILFEAAKNNKVFLTPVEIIFLTESTSLMGSWFMKSTVEDIAQETRSFINKYPHTSFTEFFASGIHVRQPVMLQKLVQVAYRLKSTALIRAVAEKVTTVDLLTAFAKVDQIHGETPDWVHFKEKCSFIDRTHLRIDIGGGLVPAAPNVALEELLDIFDELNFSDKAKPDYIDIEKSLGEIGVSSPAELRQCLLGKKMENGREEDCGIIHYVKNKIAYLGTPQAGSDFLTFFYDQIERAIKHTIAALKKLPQTQKAKAEKARIIIEFLRATPPRYCGGRIFANAIRVYNEVVKGIPTTFENQVFRSLSDYRDVLIQSVMKTSDVHEYNFLVNRLGKELGLPSHELFANFDDVHAPRDVNVEVARTTFNKRYTSKSILEWLKSQFDTDAGLKEQFTDWCKSQMPKDFEKEKFEKMEQFVTERIAQQKSLSDIRNEFTDIYELDLKIYTVKEEIQKACSFQIAKSKNAVELEIQEEVLRLRELNTADTAIKEELTKKYDLHFGKELHLRVAIDNALTNKRNSDLTQMYDALIKEVVELRNAGKNNKDIADIIEQRYGYQIGNRSVKEALEETKKYYYLQERVFVKGLNPMKFKLARVRDLCFALQIFLKI